MHHSSIRASFVLHSSIQCKSKRGRRRLWGRTAVYHWPPYTVIQSHGYPKMGSTRNPVCGAWLARKLYRLLHTHIKMCILCQYIWLKVRQKGVYKPSDVDFVLIRWNCCPQVDLVPLQKANRPLHPDAFGAFFYPNCVLNSMHAEQHARGKPNNTLFTNSYVIEANWSFPKSIFLRMAGAYPNERNEPIIIIIFNDNSNDSNDNDTRIWSW